ncbi:ABC transporter substrate-binding protein [Cellulomonas sp. McL0617]|uniref:ABC transporter substrate-binding protein n=1 Tax=Cellulomonas sp. McL0617 TaxID=3415675 RepID=UPI003CF48901
MQRSIRTIVALAGVGAALTLAGCSSSGAAASNDEWTIPTQDPTATIRVAGHVPAGDDGLKPVLAAFAKAHPTITVKYESIPFDSLNAVLDSRIANKDGNPDVYWADMPRLAALTARGYTTDLTDQFSQFENAWDAASSAGTTVANKLVAVPIANSTQLMFYNKDLLDAAGVAYPSDSTDERTTWEAIAADAKAAVGAGATNGLVFGQFDRYYQLQPLPMSLGGSAGATGEGNLTPDVTSDAWVKAFDWYHSIFEDGTSPRGVKSEQSDPDFIAGKTAYMVEGPWFLPQLQSSTVNWGVAPQPYFEGGKAVTPTGSWSLAMNPFSKEKEAAAIFLKFMSVDDGGWTQYALNPDLPANVDGKKLYFERPVFTTPAGTQAAAIIDYESSNTAVNRLATTGYVEFEDIMGRTFADIRNGADAKTSLESASAELERAWAPYTK